MIASVTVCNHMQTDKSETMLTLKSFFMSQRLVKSPDSACAFTALIQLNVSLPKSTTDDWEIIVQPLVKQQTYFSSPQ